MAVSLTTVSGPIYLPDGNTPVGGRVSFELSSWDREEGEALIVSGPVYSEIDEDGQFSVQLYTTTEGTNGVNYKMYVLWEDSSSVQSYVNNIYNSSPSPHYTKKYIGTFSLAGAGPYSISDIEIVSELESNSFDILQECAAYVLQIQDSVDETAANYVLTTADRIASAASAVTAAAARDAAEDFRNEAEAFKIAAEAAADMNLVSMGITATNTELNYVDGVTSSIQTQINSKQTLIDGKQPLDAGLTSIAALTGGADKLPYQTNTDVYATTTFTSAARALLDDADAATMRSTLGVVIGTNVQAYDAGLQSFSGLTTAANKTVYTTGPDTFAVTDLTSAGRAIIGAADAAAQITALGVTATAAELNYVDGVTSNIQTQIDNKKSGLIFIESKNLSNAATADFTGFNSALYDGYVFGFMNVLPATSGGELYLRTSTNGGSSYASSASNYGWVMTRMVTGAGSPTPDSDALDAEISLTGSGTGVRDATGSSGVCGEVKVFGPHISDKETQFIFQLCFESGGADNTIVTGSGIRYANAIVNAVRFLFSSGNIASGTITMWGYSNS